MKLFKVTRFAVSLAAALLSQTVANADGNPAHTAISLSLDWIQGPQQVNLRKVATLSLPPGYAFLGEKDTRTLLRVLRNITRGDEIGFIAPSPPSWVVVVRYLDSGFIRDAEARTLDESALLQSVRAEGEQTNSRRQQFGLSNVTLQGWEVPPSYDPLTHRLEWAVQTISQNQKVVNHCISILGRKGVVQLFLLDEHNTAAAITGMRQLAQDMQFMAGERYEDFRPGDRLALGGLELLPVSGTSGRFAPAVRPERFVTRTRLLSGTKLLIWGAVTASLGFVIGIVRAVHPAKLWLRFGSKRPFDKVAAGQAEPSPAGPSQVKYHEFYRDLTRDLYHW